MWIVRIALDRPYTFIVLAIVILFVGPIAIARTPTDIFPNINIPVVTAVWSYGGMSADELANRIVSGFERRDRPAARNAITRHVESGRRIALEAVEHAGGAL